MEKPFKPYNSLVCALLTDMYQITMAYAYWRAGRHENYSVFEVFFRKNPFQGEFTIFAGLEEVLRYVSTFRFTELDIQYLRDAFPTGTDPKFFDWLKDMDTSQVEIHAMHEGTVVFPRMPVIRVEGPLGVCQMLETAILNLTNFASLIATNAQRMRLAAGENKILLEFGLRRAQGPDGAISASRYAYMGGFNGTSNCLAGKLFGMQAKGTHAHAFVSAFKSKDDLQDTTLDGKEFYQRVVEKRKEVNYINTSESELVAFVAYAQAFPDAFLALVDTYDTLQSGVLNFVCVALVLKEFGRSPVGIRLDSGDLAYLSKETRKIFQRHGLGSLTIVASNDINEEVLHSLVKQGHEVDSFGIGTNLVTCQAQPALGMVYKIVECRNEPCVKLSNEFQKTTLPGKKQVYRLIGRESVALLDLMQLHTEEPPQPGQIIRCIHPYDERKKCDIKPTEVLPLLNCFFKKGNITCELPSAEQIRDFAKIQIRILREDHVRSLNPSVYKVSVSKFYGEFIRDLWGKNMPIELLE